MMDLAIRDATLLPCTPGMPVIDGGHVAGEVVASAGPGPGPDAGGDIAITGMVNPHAHVRTTLFRGPCEEVGDRPFRYVLPMERKFATPEMVRTGTALAARESIRTGASTVADRNSFEAGVGRVLDAAGLRSVVGQTPAAFEPPDPATLDEGYARVAALAVEFRGHPGIVPPAAPHSTDIPVPRRVADRASAHPGVPVRIHLAEMDRASRSHGCCPEEVVHREGLLRDGPIAAHCLDLDEAEISRLTGAGVRVAHGARPSRGVATDGPTRGNTPDLVLPFRPASMFQKLLGARSRTDARPRRHPHGHDRGHARAGSRRADRLVRTRQGRRSRAYLAGRPAPATRPRTVCQPRLRRDARGHVWRSLADAGPARLDPGPQEGAARRRTEPGLPARRNDQNRSTGGARSTP